MIEWDRHNATLLKEQVEKQEKLINMLTEKLGLIYSPEKTEKKPAKFVSKTSAEGKSIIKQKNQQAKFDAVYVGTPFYINQ